MGIFTKKVQHHAKRYTHLYGNPLHKFTIGRSRNKKNNVQKMFLEEYVSKLRAGFDSSTIRASQRVNSQGLHDRTWSRKKLPYSFNVEVSKLEFNEEAFEATIGANVTVLSKEFGTNASLESEYNVKLQLPSYDYTTQTYVHNGYKLKLINSSIFKVIDRPPLPDPLPPNFRYEYELDQSISVEELGVYPSFGYFENVVKKPLLYEELFNRFGVRDVEISTFATYYDAQNRVFRTSAYFTWSGHEEVRTSRDGNGNIVRTVENTYEYIYVDYDATDLLYSMFYTEKFEKRFFIEYKDSNEIRNIYKGNNYENFVTKQAARKIDFISVFPIKKYLPTDQKTSKLLDRALMQGKYKNKYKRKKPKVPAQKLRGLTEEQKRNAGKDVIETMQENGSIDEADIGQYLDIGLFFKKEIRSNKLWQRYLRNIMEYFDATLGFGTYHQDAPRHDLLVDTTLVRGPNKFKLRVQGIKRVVRYLRADKICFISTEPRSGDCYLYLNVPDYSMSTAEEKSRGIFYKFTQYGLNLSYWYSSGMLESYNFYGKNLSSQRESRSRYDRRSLTSPFYLDIDVREYSRITGELWVNPGNILDPKYVKAPKYKGDEVIQTYVIEETSFTYDDRVDYLPPYVCEVKDDELVPNPEHLCPMPVKLWRKVPHSVKLEVFGSTLMLYYQYGWEEKKGTILGKIAGFVLVIVGIVLIVVFWWSGSMAWGMGILGAGMSLLGAMYNNKMLSRIGAVLGIAAGIVGGVAMLGGSLLQQFAGVMSILGSVVSSWNFLTAIRNEQVLKSLYEKSKEEVNNLKKEGKSYDEYKKGFLNLTKYNIDIDTVQGIEDMYMVATAQHCYAMIESGKYYQLQEQDYTDIYERY